MRSRSIPASATLLVALASFAPDGAAQERRKPLPVVKHVALQIEREPDYSAHEIAALLASSAYVGAIRPELIGQLDYGIRADAGFDVAELVAIDARLASPEIVTLTFGGESAAAVAGAIQSVLEHLDTITPTRRRQAQELVGRAREEVGRTQKERSAAGARYSDFVKKNGDDLDGALNRLRDRRQSLERELESIENDHAQRSATRDYLRAALASGGSDPAAHSAAIGAAMRDLDALRESFTDTNPKVKEARERLKRLEGEVAAANMTAQSPAVRPQLEMRLFEIEEQVFGLERRREWLGHEIAAGAAREDELVALVADWRDLRSTVQTAENALADARSQLQLAERQVAQIPNGPWIRVLAK